MPPDSDETDVAIPLEHARSAILRYLAERGEPVENLELLTTAVRTAEVDRRDVGVTDLPLRTVHDCLTADHLPALDREGLVDYNRAAETVTLAVRPDRIEALLRRDGSGR